MAAIGGGSIAGIGWIAGRVKDSKGYRIAIATVRANPEVQAALGTPLDDSGFLTGSFTNGTHWHTVFAQIPLKGPKDRATLTVTGTQTGDSPWRFETLVVIVQSTRAEIDLRSTANNPSKQKLPGKH